MTALAEVFEKFPQMRYAIEIKKSGIPVEQPLCDLIRQYNMQDKVLVASFHDEVMQTFRATCPEVAALRFARRSDEVRHPRQSLPQRVGRAGL
ncbi:MAG: hypothetical protein MZV64_23265 [Ignavibacteriales bacterium]|nr:hypothetical protein [Ignavibacteriales bacterium]